MVIYSSSEVNSNKLLQLHSVLSFKKDTYFNYFLKAVYDFKTKLLY